MATNFVITANNNNQIFRDSKFKDEAITYEFNFAPWADVNGAVTTVTWTVRSGTATVSGTALASSVATGVVTFGSEGGSLIQIKATNGTETCIAYLDVLARDPNSATDDNGLYV